ncbi:hypothetical protein GWK47_024495 [Chionoecetes opilio]|uniref:CCHC-type domain-containing protein n=1 Tax=Chionoecetes opilio TaxID=41210 RepID=A0A8J4XPT1_CHIOP|nr:hypothetical protein GWK47_024495 [Chionoecetes opilio]
MAGAGAAPLLRSNSLCLLFSNPEISYESVLSVIFDTLGVRPKAVVGIQFVRVNKIIIKFAAEGHFRLFHENLEGWGAVPPEAGGGTLKIINLSQATTLVSVKDAPFEMANEAITSSLRRYGRVLSIKKHIHTHERAVGIQTGTRTLKMEVKHKIPACVTVSGYTLAIVYSEQGKACFKCGAEDHLTHDCDASVPRGNSVFYDVGVNTVRGDD